MASLTQQQLNVALARGGSATSAYEDAKKRQQTTQESQLGRDAALAQLIKGKELDQTGKQDMLTRQINEAERLRGQYGPEASVNVEGVSVGARDPLQSLLRKRELEKPSLTPGQEAADKAFGKDYSDYQAGGGKAGMEKNIGAMEGAIEGIKSTDMYDRATGFLPRIAREVVSPASVAREDAVKGAIQQTLRQTLGAQFTEKEGQALMDRAYNPRLAPEENLRRATAIANQLKQQAAQKTQSAQLFEKTGSLVGLGAAGQNHPAQAAPQKAPMSFEEWKRAKAGQ